MLFLTIFPFTDFAGKAVASLHICMANVSHCGKTHKVSLYADDLLLYMFNPIDLIPKLLLILENFRHLSGYKLNFSKSVL